MNYKLFPNIKRMTSMFCVGILCVTLSVLTLRLTVFSDMAAAPQKTSQLLSNEQDGYGINSKIYFATSKNKGDAFISNLEGNEYMIQVSITPKGKDDAIIATGFLNPGVSIGATRMTPAGQKLKNGVYDCVAEISAHNPDDLKKVGSVQVDVQVYIGVKPEKELESKPL